MGDATRQKTDALQLLHLPHAFLGIPAFGDLPAHANKADRAPVIARILEVDPPVRRHPMH